MMKEVPAKKLKNTSHSQEQRYQNNENSSWNELDDEEEKNVENFKYDNSDESQEIDKSKKQKPNPKKRKVIQVQEYQSALTKLRKVSLLYYNPFEVQKLNISLMPARKVPLLLLRCLATPSIKKRTMCKPFEMLESRPE